MSDDTAPPPRLDRAVQRSMLQKMALAHPETTDVLPDWPDEEASASRMTNLCYLEGHGLCVSGLEWTVGGWYYSRASLITSAGLDFLEADGGIEAIRRTVVVRLHGDTVRALLAAQIDAAPVTPAEKTALKKHVDQLSEAALKSATTELVGVGLRHLPDAIGWLRTACGL